MKLNQNMTKPLLLLTLLMGYASLANAQGGVSPCEDAIAKGLSNQDLTNASAADALIAYAWQATMAMKDIDQQPKLKQASIQLNEAMNNYMVTKTRANFEKTLAACKNR